MNHTDFEAARSALREARRNARCLEPVAPNWVPADLGQAMRLQCAVSTDLGRVRGWKVSGLTADQQRAMGVTSPLAGTVLERNVSIGDLAGDTPLFEVADLSKLWVDLHLFGADAQHITPGLPVEIVRLSDGVATLTKLDRVLPGTATASQSTVARATVDNADGRWSIGAAVRARVTVSTDPVDLIVPLSALQTFRDGDVVFVRVGDAYEARPLTLGRRDGVNVEVLDGLSPDDEIVVEQSYLIKADIEKSGASHDH